MKQQQNDTLRIMWAVATTMALAMLLLSETESFSPRSSALHSRVVSNTLQQQQRIMDVRLKSSYNNNNNNSDENYDIEEPSRKGDSTRRTAVARMLLSPPLVAAAAATTASAPSFAVANNYDFVKCTNLSDEDFLKIAVEKDLVQNQFLVNGKLTREIYDESCTFQDEIDTYGLEQWMSGTAKLFDASRSKVVLVPGSVKLSPKGLGSSRLLEYRFVEYLCFNVPYVKPIVFLSGTLFLKLSDTNGLITSYREKWDQDIYKVLTSKSLVFTSDISNESLDADLKVFFEANANK